MQDIVFQAAPLLNLAICEVLNTYKNRVISIFKIGSLGAHGGFSLCSDVDIVIMLDEVTDTDYQTINALWDKLKAVDVAFASILSIFWSCYDPMSFTRGAGRFPPFDRLDFLQHGILLYGIDQRNMLPAPSHQEIVVEGAKFISSYMLAGDKLKELSYKPELILAKGARYFTKFVLFPVRLLFTLEKPDVIGSNQDTVEFFNIKLSQHFPRVTKELVNMAYKYRSFPADEPVNISASLVNEGLISLYIYCFEHYCNVLQQFRETQVLQQLRNELAQLNAVNRQANPKGQVLI